MRHVFDVKWKFYVVEELRCNQRTVTRELTSVRADSSLPSRLHTAFVLSDPSRASSVDTCEKQGWWARPEEDEAAVVHLLNPSEPSFPTRPTKHRSTIQYCAVASVCERDL